MSAFGFSYSLCTGFFTPAWSNTEKPKHASLRWQPQMKPGIPAACSVNVPLSCCLSSVGGWGTGLGVLHVLIQGPSVKTIYGHCGRRRAGWNVCRCSPTASALKWLLSIPYHHHHHHTQTHWPEVVTSPPRKPKDIWWAVGALWGCSERGNISTCLREKIWRWRVLTLE